jgi:hypothetical protein
MKRENLTVKTFDYSDMDPELKGKLICLAGEINRAACSHIEFAIKMGEAISSAHELLAGGGCEGKFKPWLETECGIAKSTAYRYMNAYKAFGDCKELRQFSNEGLYLLSSPDVPRLAVAEAKKVAAKGARISIDRAKEILDKWREKAKPTATPAAENANESRETTLSGPDLDTSKPSQELEQSADSFDTAAIEAQPPKGVDIPGLASPYKRAVSALNSILNEFTALSEEERTGVHLADKWTRIRHDLTEAKQGLYQAEPIQACEKCGGKGCRSCYQSGFWTRAIVGSRKK